MAERIIEIVLMILFAFFLYSALNDILHLAEDHHYADIPLLLFCVIASAGWIAFFGALLLATMPGTRLHRYGALPHA